jgi:hypothetical protein
VQVHKPPAYPLWQKPRPSPRSFSHKFFLDQARDFLEEISFRFHTILPSGLENTRAEGLRNRSWSGLAGFLNDFRYKLAENKTTSPDMKKRSTPAFSKRFFPAAALALAASALLASALPALAQSAPQITTPLEDKIYYTIAARILLSAGGP